MDPNKAFHDMAAQAAQVADETTGGASGFHPLRLPLALGTPFAAFPSEDSVRRHHLEEETS